MRYLLIAFTAAGFLIACSPKTTEIISAEEPAEETTTATDGEMPKADIGEGKVVFLDKCIGCHGPYAPGPRSASEIDNFSKERFDAILPKMIINAELNKVQARQVSAYIYWEIEN